MKNSLILHHYDYSPYAEKIRLMLGLTNTHWYSSLTSVKPPRASVDPLTGGYRRIPVAQIGADIFCDSALIADELSGLTNEPSLDVKLLDDQSKALMEKAEKEAFFAAVGAVPPLRILGTMLRSFGPLGMYRFVKDRESLMQGGTVRPPKGERAVKIIRALLDDLEARLQHQPWIAGDKASIADFAIYHPLWLHVFCSRRELDAGPNVKDWYQRVTQIGHGNSEQISQEQVFNIARESEPRPLPDGECSNPELIGKRVSVAPVDYGIVPVEGVLAASSDTRIVLARETQDLGLLHVHFPREGYSLAAR
jgi:glutathione S-transferase